MIRYKTLKVENYKSIREATIDFTPGIYSVIGNTIAGTYSSNGSGKSSILQALTLVLFNKDFQGAPLDAVSNRHTKVPFKITLTMDIEKEGTLSLYKIVNDRSAKALSVWCEGELLSKSTAKSLKIISDLIGMSETTFKFTHYITTNSILELTSNLSNATLFNEVLQVSDLKTLGDDLLAVSKEYLEKELKLSQQASEYRRAQKVLAVTSQYDLEDLEAQVASEQSELLELEALLNEHILPLDARLTLVTEDISTLRKDIRQEEKTLNAGICSLCGTTLADKDHLEALQESLRAHRESLVALENEKTTLTQQTLKYKVAYQGTRSTLESSIQKKQNDLEVGRQLQEIHAASLAESGYSPEALLSVTEELNHTFTCLKVIKDMRDAIKSGRIYEEVMQEFFKLVNYNIQRYRQVINFKDFEVQAVAYQSGMVALVKHQGAEIPVESLSNGEKARLSLLLLSALLESMSQVTNSESNFLAIDEATASFDKSGIEELSALFAHLKRLNQSVFIITHGTELQDVHFDGQLIIHKEHNVAYAEFKHF